MPRERVCVPQSSDIIPFHFHIVITQCSYECLGTFTHPRTHMHFLTRILFFALQTEHRNPEGRTYWFNTGTRESVWEKPDGEYILLLQCGHSLMLLPDLKTPFEVGTFTLTILEVLMLCCAASFESDKMEGVFLWRQEVLLQCACVPLRLIEFKLTAAAQTDTKESKWDMPDELLLLLEKVEKEGKQNTALVYVSLCLPLPLSPISLSFLCSCMTKDALEHKEQQSPHPRKVHLVHWEALIHPHPRLVLSHSRTGTTATSPWGRTPVRCRSRHPACCPHGPTCRTTPSSRTMGSRRWKKGRRRSCICCARRGSTRIGRGIRR